MIVYVSTALLPNLGMASANRIKSLARGLIESGESVTVLIPFCDGGKKAEFKIGETQCAAFFDSKANRLFEALTWRVLFPIRIFFKLLSMPDIKCLIGYSYSVQLLFSLWLIAKIRRLPFYREVSEYPICIIKPKRFSYFGLRTFLEKYFVPKLFDGQFVMTTFIEKFYRPLSRKDCRFQLLPMTVDCERFEQKGVPPFDFPYIAYCGSMSCDRKGMNYLVKAFAKVAEQNNDYRLVLIGKANETAQREIIEGVSSEEILNRIIFVGSIPSDEVPRYIGNAKILALIRPANKQAEGGFPTKLGEYLATGVPTVVTKVGEIGEYLTDNLNVFMAKPDDVDSVIMCFNEIISNYDHALCVGRAGRAAARNFFDYKTAGQKIIDFLR